MTKNSKKEFIIYFLYKILNIISKNRKKSRFYFSQVVKLL